MINVDALLARLATFSTNDWYFKQKTLNILHLPQESVKVDASCHGVVNLLLTHVIEWEKFFSRECEFLKPCAIEPSAMFEQTSRKLHSTIIARLFLVDCFFDLNCASGIHDHGDIWRKIQKDNAYRVFWSLDYCTLQGLRIIYPSQVY